MPKKGRPPIDPKIKNVKKNYSFNHKVARFLKENIDFPGPYLCDLVEKTDEFQAHAKRNSENKS